jgi:pimeloyl-ACP methyl ester carboxylesterase
MRVDLPEGRVLDVVVAGPASGLPLVIHHGTPGAAVPFRPMVEAAARHGLRTVTYSRPGYGGSTARPGRDVATAAADTTAVLDALGAGTFLTLGYSGGGPHALACAALLPDRCLATASVAGVAPYRATGLDWIADMGADNIEEFGAARDGEEALMRYLDAHVPVLAEVRAPQLAQALGDLLSPVDRHELTGEFAEFLAVSFRAAVSGGPAGWRDDDLAFVRDWGFDLAAARRVTVWQGGQDRMVPYAHGEWLAGHLPGATARLRPQAGHLSLLVGAFDEIVGDLVGNA